MPDALACVCEVLAGFDRAVADAVADDTAIEDAGTCAG
jgi:hypothetical protein